LVGQVSAEAKRLGLKPWVALSFPGDDFPGDDAVPIAGTLASHPIEGLALIFPSPQGEPTDGADRAALLSIKENGCKLGKTIRKIKQQLGPDKKLATCVALSEIAPETTCSLHVPVKDLVRDGTLDVVCLAGAERYNYHRLRLVRDAPLQAGIFLDGRALDEKTRGGLLRRVSLEAVANPSCECLWLVDFPAELACQTVANAVEGHRQAEAQRKALEAALAAGAIVIDQEVSEKTCDDVASVHGVGQSFAPSRDGRCPLVQLYVAVRGCPGPLPPPLAVEIREDDAGKPAAKILAKTHILAAELGHEPDYRWGSARFDPPVPLKKGQTYWIHLPNVRHPEGTYVWRVVRDGATPRGHAWSSRYDYQKHTWVFRVFMQKEKGPSQ